nr:diguanylate cyclase [Lachnospiraceae bacterium]
GGDEFVIILKGEDLKNYDSLKASFYNTINEWRRDQRLSEWEKVSAAMGVAYYNEEYDNNVDNVLRRADKEMYKNKKEMRAVRE